MSEDNIKKEPSQQPRDVVRTGIKAFGEMMQGVSEAFVDAFGGFNEKLSKPKASGLAANLVESVAEGNARFLERVAKATRKSAERVATETSPAVEIDYERLATLVAEKMKEKK